MSISRTILCLALLSLSAGCQLYKDKPLDGGARQVRLQGELSRENDQWLLRPCQEQRRFVIAGEGETGLFQDAKELQAGGSDPLFADLRGELGSSRQAEADGQLEVGKVYRLQYEGPGCDDPNFKRTLLHADGQEPFWSVTVGNRGLVLERPDHEPLALPFMEEQLPEGRLNLTSEANGQRLELWVAPQHCADSMSGAVRHLSAELRLDGQVMRGCAYYGGARPD